MHRNLTDKEIDQLKEQNCSAENWEDILVKDPFEAAHIIDVNFSGPVKMGHLQRFGNSGGKAKRPGIYHSSIGFCEVGDEVRIAHVRQLEYYNIADRCVIENCNYLATTEETTFGNGTEIEILNEGGGRELPIFDRLPAHLAYIIVNYRHDAILIKRLKKIINDYVEKKRARRGLIGRDSRIINSNIIRNVWIGAVTQIDGGARLENGTVVSNEQAPVFIGSGVEAENFIIQSGSKITGGAMLSDCFIGQSVQVGKQFSAENSAFFANSEAFHGEACSLFAGPYTVTHHKSTLLIAAMTSFYNAGSGTNQSNHKYKLGPLHQGILERGSKTGSFSYLLWPCRIGAFSAVIGKHYANFDTAKFPFSYIEEIGGKSVLTPAMNLFTVGTRRDSQKWPMRDKRKDPNRLDIIRFDLFNPYIIGKVMDGISVLNELYEKADRKQEYVTYKGIQLKRLLLKRTRKYYEMVLDIYLGSEILQKIESTKINDIGQIRAALKASPENFGNEWVDLAGMLTAKSQLNLVIEKIKAAEYDDFQSVESAFRELDDRYPEFAWNWCVRLIESKTGKPVTEIDKDDLIRIINDWKESGLKFNNLILGDAVKEFDSLTRIGFGIDGDEQTRDSDFEAVRGTYENNAFVKALREESDTIEKRAAELTARLEKL